MFHLSQGLIWDEVLEKMERKFANWKMIYLSKGCRITLIKIKKRNYFQLAHLFFITISTTLQVGPLVRKTLTRFLMEGMDEELKFHLENWATLCTPIHGCLKSRNLLAFNKALLGKRL